MRLATLALTILVAIAMTDTIDLGWGFGLSQEVPGLEAPLVAQFKLTPDIGGVTPEMRVVGTLHRTAWALGGQTSDGYALLGYSLTGDGASISAGAGAWLPGWSLEERATAIYGALNMEVGPLHMVDILFAVPVDAGPETRRPFLISALVSVGV